MPEKVNYNPDILSCLANLSSDEVFTPPEIANAMLDMLPQELFRSPDTKFLDPGCKSGVFLREIAKRLNEGLKDRIPDVEQRMDHIMKNQLFAIAITQITGLLSRRSVYCSKDASGRFSVARFDNSDGNIRYRRVEHKWVDGRCSVCGASKEVQDRGVELETHAYEFIHMDDNELKELKDMKFDVIIGNPPYHLDTAGAGRQAKPIYNLFVSQAKKLNPRYLTMIIPSRWFAGGMGLDGFRSEMMGDRRICRLVDYTNAKDCFPGISLGGGACYFLWSRDYDGDCEITNITNKESDTVSRRMDEFPVLVRYNKAVSIIHKILLKQEGRLDSIISSLMPFGLSTNFRGNSYRQSSRDLEVHSSEGVSFASNSVVEKGRDLIDKYKVLVSKTGAEHAGEPGKDGKFRVIPSSMKVLGPNEICTHSYFVVGSWREPAYAENALSYLRTKFVRFLMLMCMSGFGLSKLVFQFVPMQDFSKPWTDEELYKKYSLTDDEIAFIESMIKPMDLGGADA